MLIRRALAALCLAAPLALTGCAGLSFQSYGSAARGHTVSSGAPRADVFANLGEPDSVFLHNDNEILVYKAVTGANFFGLYAKIRRKDHVVVLDQSGVVAAVLVVDGGFGHTFFGAPAVLDITSPVRTSELLESVENYSVEKQ